MWRNAGERKPARMREQRLTRGGLPPNNDA
jgi:hypothetical protein